MASIVDDLTADDLLTIDSFVLGRTLRKFVRGAWGCLEGDPDSFTAGWHIDAICDHLQAVSDGQIKRLLINIPPRFSKSTIVSVCWPAWEWANRPWTKFLCTSYNKDLALRDAVSMRLLCNSLWYQQRWGHVWEFQDDANQKSRFINDHRGHRFSTGTLAQILGEGGDILTIDDPHSVQERESREALQATCRWFHEGFLTRFNNAKTGRVVVVGQRVNAEDLSAELKADPDWTCLVLPNEYIPKTHCITRIGFEDPRHPESKSPLHDRYSIARGEGALLCEERFGPDETSRAKSAHGLGSVAYGAQFQQDPVPPGGAFFKSKHFSRWTRQGGYYRLHSHNREQPRIVEESAVARFITADTASTDKTYSDYTAICCWGITEEGWLLLLDIDHGKYEIPAVRSRIKLMAAKWSAPLVCIEFAASGIGVVQDLQRDTGLIVIPVMPSMDLERIPGITVKITDKVGRASLAQIQFEGGDLYLPTPDLLPECQDVVEPELLAFSAEMAHAHDDIVDNFGYAVMMRLRGVYGSAASAVAGQSDDFRAEGFR
jgi:predicted phage terminase large subunit-like protein